MSNSKVISIGVVFAAFLVGGALWMVSAKKSTSVSTSDSDDPTERAMVVHEKASRNSAERKARATVARLPRHEVVSRPKPVLDLTDDDEDDDKRTPAEKALAAKIEKALDEEDFELAMACAREAASSTNTEIRQAMVDTLGWFGVKALPELTPYLADADEDVRDSAQNEWSMALSCIENDGEKAGVVEMTMQVLTDEDFLEEISGESIGIDEKLAVESLLRIIEGSGSEKGIAKAKETYEFVTGEEFTDRAAAEKWLAEEYQPPTENN